MSFWPHCLKLLHRTFCSSGTVQCCWTGPGLIRFSCLFLCACLCKKLCCRVPCSSCHTIVSVCVQFSLVHVVNNCFPIKKSFCRRKYMKLYQFKKEDKQSWNTLRMCLVIYLCMMIYRGYFRNFLHYRDLFSGSRMFFKYFLSWLGTLFMCV